VRRAARPLAGGAPSTPSGATGRWSAAASSPHLRIEGCESCKRYLIDVDLGRDARATPEVDELAALPLDLFAAERGLTKVTPNLMGF
jgi:FdhE protein